MIYQNRILGEIEEQIEQILVVAFENYNSLDEKLPYGVAPPVLEHAVKLYILTNDILSPEAQDKLYSYFQVHNFACFLIVFLPSYSSYTRHFSFTAP